MDLGHLKEGLATLAEDFNSKTKAEILRKYELTRPDLQPFELEPEMYYLMHDMKADICGSVVKVKVGPIKSLARAEAKVRTLREELLQEGYQASEPAGKYILDFLRATCCFEDPFALRLFLEALGQVFEVLRVKNKHHRAPTPESGSPSILVNLVIPTPNGPVVAEVQLLLQAFLDAKTVQHKSYEVSRVPSIHELMRAPLFRRKRQTLRVTSKGIGLRPTRDLPDDTPLATRKRSKEAPAPAGLLQTARDYLAPRAHGESKSTPN